MSQEHPTSPTVPAAPATAVGHETDGVTQGSAGADAGQQQYVAPPAPAQQPYGADPHAYDPQRAAYDQPYAYPAAQAPTQHPAGQEHLPARSRRLWSTTVVAIVAAVSLVLGGLVGAGAAVWGAADSGPGNFQPGDGTFPGGQFPGQDSGTSNGSSL
ncbi:hypothetical protein ATJ88_0537 [Isoptericola jiangsuensis]|uniref:Uncharacterized protein n=1 Tax=Isoptericola jiangsuensis TaxID=548579 RepID=A0A2A9EUQ7_9MICO|nr:hypothetical protein [Isoptericola jiangsuensis]PFG41889.1 hypothetical protein ATJ88_0537 [Isoptericola jiangsuensis]